MQRELLQRLMDQAFLYDDPTAYQAGVQAAWRALREEPAIPSAPPPRDLAPAEHATAAS